MYIIWKYYQVIYKGLMISTTTECKLKTLNRLISIDKIKYIVIRGTSIKPYYEEINLIINENIAIMQLFEEQSVNVLAGPWKVLLLKIYLWVPGLNVEDTKSFLRFAKKIP